MIETHELEAAAKKAGFEGVYAWFCGLKGSDAYACTPKIVSTFDDLTGLQTDAAITRLMALFLGDKCRRRARYGRTCLYGLARPASAVYRAVF